MDNYRTDLTFSDVDEGWVMARLGDVVSFQVTNSFSRDNLNYKNGKVKNIHYGDIHTKYQTLFDVSKEYVPFINPEIDIQKIKEGSYCQEGDLILADASEDLADVGKSIEIVALNDEKLVSGLHTILARPNKGVFPKGFIGYLFKSDSIRKQIQKESQGTKVLSISATRLQNLIIHYPLSIIHSTKIASCLSALDEVIAAHSQKLDLLKDHKKGLMQNLFPQEGKKVPKYRFKEFEKDGEWVEEVLGEICDVRDGTHDSPKYLSKGYPMITSKNLLINGMIDFNNVSYLSEEDYAQINKRSKVDIDDILFGMIGTIGNPVIVKNDGFAIKNVALIKDIGKLNQEFLLHYLKSNYILTQFDKVNAGGILKFIALGVIRNLTVLVPSPKEQQKIASCLSSLDALITAQAEKIEQLKLHKRGLMQGLFPKIID